jgi:esterase/lipase/1-acyl-sn-glycerol-3-phosphate acyltransferase
MSIKTFGYTSLVMNLLEKILGTKFSVTGIENLSDQPTMFVANHFTRSETFFVPYIIYKKTSKQSRTLADSKLYFGILGKFLNSVGTISTKNEKRDNIILGDLIKGLNNWIIYPEGSMVKNKLIIRKNLFISSTPSRTGPVRTGSAVLALKSQLLRQDFIEAYQKNDRETLAEFKNIYDLEYSENLENLQTQIVPLNVTYYPIRPGRNKIQAIANRLIKKIPSQIAEELEIEGNILTGAEINIHFGKPINLANYVKNKRLVVNQIPIIKKETKNNIILRYYRSKLTNDFMEKIYNDCEINFDHIFISSLIHFSYEKISISFLKKIIYYSAILIAKSNNYRYNHSIARDHIVRIFCDEKFHAFDDVFDLAIKQNIIRLNQENIVEINKNLFEKNLEFHEIRLENTLHVIANEFALLENANAIVKRIARLEENELSAKIFNEIYQADLKNFELDYKQNFDKTFSKDQNIGKPFFLDNQALPNKSSIGIVLCHGYKSAPKEVELLANFLNELGFKVYAVRLKGHGTSPIDQSRCSYEDWYQSLQIGYSALSMICEKIIMIGFSMGGLLTLLSASKKSNNSKLLSIISINSALKLNNFSAKFARGFELWNDILEKFDIHKGQLSYVDDHPENPDINYSRNYIASVAQLEKLMDECDKNLSLIKCPTLVIQGDNDPVVNPISGQNIYNKINSSVKFLSILEFKNHVIIYCNDSQKVFDEIKKFFVNLKLF